MSQHGVDPTPRTKTDIVKMVENDLGWAWSWEDSRPAWKIRAIEVSKLNRVIKRIEREKRYLKGKFTVENLALAVALLAKERCFVSSPSFVAYHVERALGKAVEPADEQLRERTSSEEVWDLVMEIEDDEQRAHWFGRVSRTTGAAREEVEQELRAWLGGARSEAANGR